MSRRRRLCFTLTAIILVGMMSAGGTAWGGGIKLRVSAEQANIREKPDIMSVILQQLSEGATLEAERKEGEWYAVLVEKEEGGFVLGYVHESLVMVIEAAPPARPEGERAEDQEPEAAKPVEVEEEPAPPSTQAPPAPGKKEKKEQVGLIIWAGGRHTEVGDLNDGAQGLADYFGARLSAAADDEVDEVHFSYLFGAEVQVPLGSGFYLSLGVERASAEAPSSVTYEGGSSEAAYSAKPSFEITPISLALIVRPFRSVYAKAGLDFTLAQCAYYYRLSNIDPDAQTEFWQVWQAEATSSGFGYQIGLGLEWPIGSFISLVAEGIYRHGRVDDFEGENLYEESTEFQSREEGTLYDITASAGGPETYPLVFIRNREPSEAGVVDVRKAELDLSGYSLRFGLKIRF